MRAFCQKIGSWGLVKCGRSCVHYSCRLAHAILCIAKKNKILFWCTRILIVWLEVEGFLPQMLLFGWGRKRLCKGEDSSYGLHLLGNGFSWLLWGWIFAQIHDNSCWLPSLHIGSSYRGIWWKPPITLHLQKDVPPPWILQSNNSGSSRYNVSLERFPIKCKNF